MTDCLDRLGHLVFAEELLHHQKFREMIVATVLQLPRMPALLQIDQRALLPGNMGQPIHASRSGKTVLRATRHDSLAGGLEARLDIAQHREDFRCVGFLEQNHLALLHGERVGAHVKIRFGQTARSPERIICAADLLVSFLEDFERLIIVRLCLNYDFKHLDRLNDLTMLLLG